MARRRTKAEPKRSLAQFIRDQNRAACKVCRLSKPVLDQLANAKTRKIRRPQQLAWLERDCGVKITDAELTNHYSGKHDIAAA